MKNGFIVNEDYIKKEPNKANDLVLKNNKLYKIYETEPQIIYARIYTTIEHALNNDDKYIFIESLGKFFKKEKDYLIDVNSKTIILKENKYKLPLMYDVIYNNKKYVVYKNKNKAILALVVEEDTDIEDGYIFYENEFYFYLNGNKIDTKEIEKYSDYKISNKINKASKYIITKDISLESKYFENFDKIYMYKPIKDKIKIKSDVFIYQKNKEILIDTDFNFISIIYFNERFYIEEIL